MAKMKLSPPWDIFYRKVNAMFAHDNEVRVIFDEEALSLKLYVGNPSKADALMQLFPIQKEFGNVNLQIEVIPPNEITKSSSENLVERAFYCNEAVSYIRQAKGVAGFPDMTFVVFIKQVVQFYTDNLCDINGFMSTLYQDIANDIFIKPDGVYFCTDLNDNSCYPTVNMSPSWP